MNFRPDYVLLAYFTNCSILEFIFSFSYLEEPNLGSGFFVDYELTIQKLEKYFRLPKLALFLL